MIIVLLFFVFSINQFQFFFSFFGIFFFLTRKLVVYCYNIIYKRDVMLLFRFNFLMKLLFFLIIFRIYITIDFNILIYFINNYLKKFKSKSKKSAAVKKKAWFRCEQQR